MQTLTLDSSDDIQSSTGDVVWRGYFRGETYPMASTYSLKETVDGKDISEYGYTASGLDTYDGGIGGFKVTNTYEDSEDEDSDAGATTETTTETATDDSSQYDSSTFENNPYTSQSASNSGELLVWKYWIGTPQDSITVSLYTDSACSKEYGTYTITPSKCYKYWSHIWEYRISGLPTNTNFWMKEQGINGYKITYHNLLFLSGWAIFNTYDGVSRYSDSGTNTSETTAAKTGDDNNFLLYGGMMVAAIVCGTAIVIIRKRKKYR